MQYSVEFEPLRLIFTVCSVSPLLCYSVVWNIPFILQFIQQLLGTSETMI